MMTTKMIRHLGDNGVDTRVQDTYVKEAKGLNLKRKAL